MKSFVIAPFMLATLLLALPLPGWGADANTVQDAFTVKTAPDQNYGSNKTLSILQREARPVFIQFDQAPLAGAEIEKATLKLPVSRVFEQGPASIFAIFQPWSENTVTYETNPAWASVPEGEVFVTSPGTYEIDLTSLARRWASGALPNHGIALSSRDATAYLPSKETGVDNAASLNIELSGEPPEPPEPPPDGGTPAIASVQADRFETYAQRTIGWNFKVTRRIRVTQLGVYNRDGLQIDVPVAIWDPAVSKSGPLGQIQVPAGTPGGASTFSYQPLNPTVVLQPGRVYTLGSYEPGELVFKPTCPAFICNFATEVTAVFGTRSPEGDTIQYPKWQVDSFVNIPFVGPNFKFVEEP